jgi:hypothetical protein
VAKIKKYKQNKGRKPSYLGIPPILTNKSTLKFNKAYKFRKEKIERSFAESKELHGLLYYWLR